MAKQVIALYIAMVAPWLIATGVMATVGVKALDKATAAQCRTHDWPIKAHKIHMDWCADNGYVTK